MINIHMRKWKVLKLSRVFIHPSVLGNSSALTKDTAVPKHADSQREGTETTIREYFGPG